MPTPQRVSRWTSNLKDPKEIQDFQEKLNQAQYNTVLRRLYDIIKEDQEMAAKAASKSANYDSPSWAYAQADSLGYQRALNNIELLLKGIFK